MREDAPLLPARGTPLRLDLLGSITITGPHGDAGERLLRQSKRTAVFAYVAAKGCGRPVRRDELLALFWPDSPSSRARAALRQTIHYIHSSFESMVLQRNGGEAVCLCRQGVSCDVVDFEKHVREEAWGEALGLYRGDFLEGFHAAASNEFEDWMETRRTELRGKAARGAWKLAAQARAEGERAGEAAFWGKRALDLSPLTDHGVRRLMLLLESVGDRAGALRAFAGLEEVLRREHGVAPAPETADLRDRIALRSPDAVAGTLPPEMGPRRTGHDRRRGDRRTRRRPRDGKERRSGQDRRTGNRRSGRDRRR